MSNRAETSVDAPEPTGGNAVAALRSELAGGRAPLPLRRVAAVLLVPLVAVITFALCYVSAFHAPAPHDLALRVVGTSATVQRVETAVQDAAPGGFDITADGSAAAAIAAVRDRDAVGALVLQPDSTTIVIASGGGKAAASAVTALGDEVAARLGAPAVVQDVAPLTADDAGGTTLFYLLLMGTMGGFLVMLAMLAIPGGTSRRTRIVAALAGAVVIPVLSFATIAFFVGDLGMDLGHLAASAGIDALYVLTVALLALVLQELLGRFALVAALFIVFAFNLPSSGGIVQESVLPPFWQALHAVWFGSGAVEAIRSLAYFGGDGFAWPFVRLCIWLGAVAVAAVLVPIVLKRRGRSLQPIDQDELEEGEALAAAAAVAAAVA